MIKNSKPYSKSTCLKITIIIWISHGIRSKYWKKNYQSSVSWDFCSKLRLCPNISLLCNFWKLYQNLSLRTFQTQQIVSKFYSIRLKPWRTIWRIILTSNKLKYFKEILDLTFSNFNCSLWELHQNLWRTLKEIF